MNEKVKKMTATAMLCAIAYLVTIIRIPVVLFLEYGPADIIIALGGFIFGPLTAFTISVVTAFIEMITISDTGWIGFLMNVISTCSFVCIAAFIYKKLHSMKGAIIGLVTGVISMTCIMLLWNYLITPIYMGYDRAMVAEMLVPYFLPYNLLKGGINASITILVYKPIVMGLRKARLIPNSKAEKNKSNIGIMLVAVAVLATCIVVILAMNGII